MQGRGMLGNKEGGCMMRCWKKVWRGKDVVDAGMRTGSRNRRKSGTGGSRAVSSGFSSPLPGSSLHEVYITTHTHTNLHNSPSARWKHRQGQQLLENVTFCVVAWSARLRACTQQQGRLPPPDWHKICLPQSLLGKTGGPYASVLTSTE